VTDARNAQVAIHAKVVEIAKQLGNDARKLRFDEEIPASGLLDSAGLMELMMWFETEFGLTVDQEDLTIANFGTIDAMVQYLIRSQS
jgi:D-alanine--poly(phosphoribitol) ligase subunit 2